MIIRKIAATLFELIGKLRVYLYLNNYLKRVNTGKKVISVGNLSMGGTGKTPLVLLLTRFISNYGYNTALIEKGYKSKLKSNEIILAEKGLDNVSTILIGDEAALAWENLPNKTKLAIGKNKSQCAANIVDKWSDTEYIIVDDGFQHLKLNRDIDIVLLDAETGFNDKLFPLGKLREPYSSLKRASIVLFTKSDNIDDNVKTDLRDKVLLINPLLKVFFAGLELKSSVELNSKTILPVSAIYNNKHYLSGLRKAGARFSNYISYPDHYGFTMSDVQYIRKLKKEIDAEYIVVTSKDWVKLRNFINVDNDPVIIVWYEHKIESLKEFISCCLG